MGSDGKLKTLPPLVESLVVPVVHYCTLSLSDLWPELCECINPFQDTRNHYRGDPEALCSHFGPGFCYVECNQACRDQKFTATRGRCQSSLACAVHRGDILEKVMDLNAQE